MLQSGWVKCYQQHALQGGWVKYFQQQDKELSQHSSSMVAAAVCNPGLPLLARMHARTLSEE